MTSIHDKFRYQSQCFAENLPDNVVGLYLQCDDKDFTLLVKIRKVIKNDDSVVIWGWYCDREDNWEDNEKERAVLTMNPSDTVWLYERWAFDNPLTPVGTM